MLFLTATPIFDNIKQLAELAEVMDPDIRIRKLGWTMGTPMYLPGNA
jgi:hypothetical protein